MAKLVRLNVIISETVRDDDLKALRAGGRSDARANCRVVTVRPRLECAVSRASQPPLRFGPPRPNDEGSSVSRWRKRRSGGGELFDQRERSAASCETPPSISNRLSR